MKTQPGFAPISSVRPVPRTRTLAGGYRVKLDGLPEKQSGQSGTRVVAAMADDPKAEANRLLLDLIGSLASVVQDVNDGRHIVASENLKAALMRIGDARSYVDRLAMEQQVPLKCHRCQVEPTHDPKGLVLCDGCISATYGRTVIR